MPIPDPPDLDGGFFLAWVNMCGRLRINPFDLIRVSYSESGGVRPKAHNPNGNAVGLIQFMPDTLNGLGWTKGWQEFLHLDAVQQIPFVERYYRPYASNCTSDALCYVATFLPALLPAAAGAMEGARDFVLCGQRGPLAWAYAANRVFDRDGKGSITVGDLAAQLERACQGARYGAIVQRLHLAMGNEPPPLPEPAPTQPALPDDEPIVHPDVEFPERKYE